MFYKLWFLIDGRIPFFLHLSLIHIFAASQQTINKDGENIAIEIKGRHDPIVVARAVVVVECMTALVLADALLVGMSATLDNVKKVWALDEK